jgi:hypothetical protein
VKTLDKQFKMIAAGKYKPADFILADAMTRITHSARGNGARRSRQSGLHRSIPQFLDRPRHRQAEADYTAGFGLEYR